MEVITVRGKILGYSLLATSVFHHKTQIVYSIYIICVVRSVHYLYTLATEKKKIEERRRRKEGKSRQGRKGETEGIKGNNSLTSMEQSLTITSAMVSAHLPALMQMTLSSVSSGLTQLCSLANSASDSRLRTLVRENKHHTVLALFPGVLSSVCRDMQHAGKQIQFCVLKPTSPVRQTGP